MPNKVYAIGVGMTKFEKPGRRVNDDGSPWDYPDMARESGSKALADAGIDYREVQEAYVGYENTSYFYRLFHERYGQSPREYRQSRAARTRTPA